MKDKISKNDFYENQNQYIQFKGLQGLLQETIGQLET